MPRYKDSINILDIQDFFQIKKTTQDFRLANGYPNCDE
jgi:hypothetical protein